MTLDRRGGSRVGDGQEEKRDAAASDAAPGRNEITALPAAAGGAGDGRPRLREPADRRADGAGSLRRAAAGGGRSGAGGAGTAIRRLSRVDPSGDRPRGAGPRLPPARRAGGAPAD